MPGFARNDGGEVTGLPRFARNDGCEVGGLPRFARNDGCEVAGLPRFPSVARNDERREMTLSRGRDKGAIFVGRSARGRDKCAIFVGRSAGGKNGEERSGFYFFS